MAFFYRPSVYEIEALQQRTMNKLIKLVKECQPSTLGVDKREDRGKDIIQVVVF